MDCDILESFVWQMALGLVPTAYQRDSEIHIWGGQNQIDVTSLFVDVTGNIPFHITHEMTGRK